MNKNKVFATFIIILLAVSLCIVFIGDLKTAKGSLLPSSILQYVPIKITNAQNSPTQSHFQQAIMINSAAYSQYEAADLSNIEFFDASGNIIPSWLESGNYIASTFTIYWLSITNGIPANSNLTVYMGFASPTTNLLYSKTTGEAPELSQVYGAYDNGANIFSFYDNFAGTSLSSKWTNDAPNSGNIVTINNQITVAPSSSENNLPAIYSKTAIGQGVLDFEGTIPAGGNSKTSVSSYATVGLASSANTADNLVSLGVSGLGGQYGLTTFSATGVSGSETGLQFETESVYSIIIPSTSPTTVTAQFNYLSTNEISSKVNLPQLPQPIMIQNQKNTGISIGPIHWIRVRDYPPNGVMPTATFSSVSNGSPTPSLTSTPSVPEIPSGLILIILIVTLPALNSPQKN